MIERICHKIKRICSKTARAIKYAIHGYSSEDWDFQYLLKDIKFKVNLMHKETQKFITILDKDSINELLKHYENLIRLIDNELNDVYMEKVGEEIADVQMVEKSKDEHGNVEVDFVITYINPDMTHEKYDELKKEAQRRKDLNLKFLFEYLNDYLRHLWI